MATGPEFPAFLSLKTRSDGSAKATLLAEIDDALGAAERRFQTSFDQIGSIIQRSTASFGRNGINLDLDSTGLRQAAADAGHVVEKLSLLREATRSLISDSRALGAEFGDVSQETIKYEQALSAQLIVAERASQEAHAQVDAYNLLQTRVTKLAGENDNLARSYRAIYEEQAKAENLASNSQRIVNAKAAPALDPFNAATRNGATTSALAEMLLQQEAMEKQQAATAAAAAEIENLRAKEEAAARGADILATAYAGTALEIGRVTKSARDSASVFSAFFADQERNASQAAAASAAKAGELAAAQEKVAASAAQLRSQLDPAIAAQQRFDAEMVRADSLLEAGAISTKEYAAAQALARQNLQASWAALTQLDVAQQHIAKTGTNSFGAVTNSVRAHRVAMTQLGQQMQDVVVQTQMGTSAITIFTQQVPQAAFALSGLSDSANKTQARIGQFASFLSGPWGAAIFMATALLGPFIAGLFKSGDAAEDAKGKTYDFSKALNVLELSAGQTANAMRQLADETRTSIAVMGDFLQTKALIAGQSVSDLEGRIAQNQSKLSGLKREANSWGALIPFNGPSSVEMGNLEKNLAADREALKYAQQAKIYSDRAIAQQQVIEKNDPRAAATGAFERGVGDLNSRYDKYNAPNADPLGPRMSKEQYATEFDGLVKTRDAALAATSAKDKHTKSSDAGAKAAQREAKALDNLGDRAKESIASINDRFNEQPRLIDQAAAATRDLDKIMSDLMEKDPKGTNPVFQGLIKDAQDTKAVVEDALIRPFREFDEDAQRRVEVQRLMVTGREDEADALQEIWRLESVLGPLSEERKQHVRETVIAENEAMRALEGQRTIMESYLDATRSVRSELENLFQGKSVNFKEIFKQLQSKVLVEQLFGPALRSLEDYVKQNTFGPAVDDLTKETTRAGGSVGEFADAVDTATQRILNPKAANDNYAGGGSVASILAMGLASVKGSGAGGSAGMAELLRIYQNNAMPIGVTAPKGLTGGDTILKLSPEAYFSKMSQSIIKPMTDGLDKIFGTKFFGKMEGALSGAFSGYMTGGTTGGILGALQGVVGTNTKLGAILGKGMQGAATGTMVAGIGNMLGLKMSDTGAQIGGALGSALPIPGGAIIGSIVGGLIGKLFHKAKWGNATLSGGNLNVGSNQNDMGSAAGSAGGDVQGALDKIASSLGASVGNYLVSIGVTDNKWRISTTGRTGELKSKYSDVTVFGEGDEAYAQAVKAAIADAIKDGAIIGLRATTQRIIQTAKDVDTGVQNAIDFESVFKRLREYKDPVGAAIDRLDTEFKKLKDIFDSAGATVEEYAQLEELYGIERAKAIKEANDKIVASLRGLYDDLTMGDNGLSLRDRMAAAQAAYDPLKARVQAGDTTAYDDYAEAARQLLDLQRQIYGSQSPYFDLFNEIKNLSKSAIDAQSAVDTASANSDSPFSSQSAATSAANDNQIVVNALDQLGANLLDGLTPQLAALNTNLIRFFISRGVSFSPELAAQYKSAAGQYW